MTGQNETACFPEGGESLAASHASTGGPSTPLGLMENQTRADGAGSETVAAAAAGDQTAHAARAAALREKRPRAQRGKVAVAWLVNAVKQLAEPHGSAPHDVAKFAARALGLPEQQLDLPVRLGLARAQRQGLLQRASAGKYMIANAADMETAGCGVPSPCRKRVKQSCRRRKRSCSKRRKRSCSRPRRRCKRKSRSRCKPRYYYYYYCRRTPNKCARKRKQLANASCCCKSKAPLKRRRSCSRRRRRSCRPRPRCKRRRTCSRRRKKSCPRKKRRCPKKPPCKSSCKPGCVRVRVRRKARTCTPRTRSCSPNDGSGGPDMASMKSTGPACVSSDKRVDDSSRRRRHAHHLPRNSSGDTFYWKRDSMPEQTPSRSGSPTSNEASSTYGSSKA